jgi:hypothetical protein
MVRLKSRFVVFATLKLQAEAYAVVAEGGNVRSHPKPYKRFLLTRAILGDGAQPQCWNCRARGEECRWGLKASFHPSRALQLSSEDSAALLAIEEERDLAGARSSTVVSQRRR